MQYIKKQHYKQGFYHPVNPQKYAGDPSNIIYRSSWELKCCKSFDLSPTILAWSSETTVIKYLNPIDNKMHRYFVDFWIRTKRKDGSIKEYLIEVKPLIQTQKPIAPTMPKRPKDFNIAKKRYDKKLNRYEKEVKTWIINQSKWKAAKLFCEGTSMKFLIMDENALNIPRK